MQAVGALTSRRMALCGRAGKVQGTRPGGLLPPRASVSRRLYSARGRPCGRIGWEKKAAGVGHLSASFTKTARELNCREKVRRRALARRRGCEVRERLSGRTGTARSLYRPYTPGVHLAWDARGFYITRESIFRPRRARAAPSCTQPRPRRARDPLPLGFRRGPEATPPRDGLVVQD